MKRRTLLGAAVTVAGLAIIPPASAQQPPIKIGMSMAQTGGLAGGGKASLLGTEIWRDDINARGGLLGRKVELVVYDDKSSASETPAIYSKLLDVDKVDLLFSPYATVPTAPIMPLVKQRGMVLIGNFSFQINSKIGHDMWFNVAPWGPADSWASAIASTLRPPETRSSPSTPHRRPSRVPCTWAPSSATCRPMPWPATAG
jgi:branched-chain amino acid transport system substrate-binding protein